MDAVQQMASQPDTGFFSSNGLFGKIVDTAGDIYAQRQANKNAAIVASVAPTGDTNPGVVAQDQLAARGPAAPAAAQLMAWMPWIITGAAIITVAAVAYRFANK